MHLNFQYVTDQQGKKTALVIPIQKGFNEQDFLEFLEYKQLKRNLKKSLEEVKAIQNKESASTTLKDFLNGE